MDVVGRPSYLPFRDVVRDYGAKGDGTTDDYAAIQAALNAGAGTVTIPNTTAFFRTDTTLVVPSYVTVQCFSEVRRVAAAAAVTPVVNVQQTKAEWIGGKITTEKAHASGVVILGHDSTAAAYTTTKWLLRDCQVTGVQTAGNIGLRLVNAQSLNPVNPANYFGSVINVTVLNADVGVQAEEVANAHCFVDVLCWNMITAGFRFYGAYANSVIGGFVHTSTNGVIGIALENARSAQPHNSDNNFIMGLGVEPTGAASKGFTIGTNCILNSLDIDDNCTGGNTIGNTGNRINAMFGGFSQSATATYYGALNARAGLSVGQDASNGKVTVSATNASSPQYVLGNAAGTPHWAMYETLGAAGQQASLKFADIVAGYLDYLSLTPAVGAVLAVHPTGGLGYGTGAGGSVVQATNKSTAVTLNKVCGQITMNAANLTATTSVAFTLNNSAIAANDCVHVNIKSGATANSYFVSVDLVAGGSCSISLRNYTAGALAEGVLLQFVVIKAVIV